MRDQVYYDEYAFPNKNSGGLTLRDYFAAKAMCSILGSHADHTLPMMQRPVAEMAYKMADQMMSVRTIDVRTMSDQTPIAPRPTA